MCLINLRYIRKEVEDKIDGTLGKVMLGEETGFIVENAVITVIQDMEEVKVILEEVVFKEGLILLLGEMIIGIEIERVEDHGDSLDQEKEEWELDQNQVLDQVQGLAQTGIESDALNVGNKIILQMNVQI